MLLTFANFLSGCFLRRWAWRLNASAQRPVCSCAQLLQLLFCVFQNWCVRICKYYAFLVYHLFLCNVPFSIVTFFSLKFVLIEVIFKVQACIIHLFLCVHFSLVYGVIFELSFSWWAYCCVRYFLFALCVYFFFMVAALKSLSDCSYLWFILLWSSIVCPVTFKLWFPGSWQVKCFFFLSCPGYCRIF